MSLFSYVNRRTSDCIDPTKNFSDNGERYPLVSIPDTEVKVFSADGTWLGSRPAARGAGYRQAENARERLSLPDSTERDLTEVRSLFLCDGKRDPPVPIPNTEVKPFSADGTWLGLRPAAAQTSQLSLAGEVKLLKSCGDEASAVGWNQVSQRLLKCGEYSD